LWHDSYFVQSFDFIRNYITRQPKTKCLLNFCDDVHVASFKKFRKEPTDGKMTEMFSGRCKATGSSASY